MFTEPRKILFRSIGLLLLAIVIIFAYHRYKPYIAGPSLAKINLESYMSVDEPFINVQADIKNTQSVTINGRDIFLEKKEDFEEIIALSKGVNTLEIRLEDTFGKEKIYRYTIYYTAEERDIPISLEIAKERQVEELELLKETNA